MKNRGKIEDLLAVVLVGIFAVCVLLVLLSGTEIYHGLAERGQAGYEDRTAVQYISARLRQGDAAGSVRLETFGGVDTLVLSQDMEGAVYETRVYCSGGYLRELFTREGNACAPEDGDTVLPLTDMKLLLQDGVLFVELMEPDGGVRQVILSLRSESGVEP